MFNQITYFSIQNGTNKHNIKLKVSFFQSNEKAKIKFPLSRSLRTNETNDGKKPGESEF